jgi:crossover junction endodeoxyribonuclease RusA
MRPEPQGSAKAFVIKGTNRAVVTSDNKKLRPFRSELTRMAIAEMGDRPQPLFPKGAPVSVSVGFGFIKPASVKKGRVKPCVKPDIDKLLRAVLDSLTGVAFHDDAQVVQVHASKSYLEQDQVTVTVREAD